MIVRTAKSVLFRVLLCVAAFAFQAWPLAHAGNSDRFDERQWHASHGGESKFTIAVIPDTQYLFDEDRGNRTVVEKSLQWIVENRSEKNIVFTIHLGDSTVACKPPASTG